MPLTELHNRVLTLPTLENRLAYLRKEIQQSEDEVADLLRRYEQERRDVAQIQKESFSTFLYKLAGKYEDKLEKEQREAIEAKLTYDRAVIRRDSLIHKRNDLAARVAALRADAQTYQTELARRRQALADKRTELADKRTEPADKRTEPIDKRAEPIDKRTEPADKPTESISARYTALENERNAIISQMTEIKEARSAAARAKSTAEEALASLEKAQGWATYDAITRGGIISHMAKYSHIDSAEACFHRLSSQLRDMKAELNDVQGLSLPGFNEISSGQRAIDFWLDNIFTDLSVRAQIKDNVEEVNRLLDNISAAESALNAKWRAAEATLADNKRREEALLLSLQ